MPIRLELQEKRRNESPKGETLGQSFITVRDFVEKDYFKKIAEDKCTVVMRTSETFKPPKENAPALEKKAWEYLTSTTENDTNISRISKIDDDYYDIEGMLVNGDRQLIVFSKTE